MTDTARRAATRGRIADAEQVAAIAARTGMSVDTVARIRRRLHMAWSPASADEYMSANWFVFERADRPDPEIRL